MLNRENETANPVGGGNHAQRQGPVTALAIGAKFILCYQMEPRMRRQNFRAAADDDSLPVMVPRNDKAAVPISHERVRRLRKHLVVALRALRTMKNPKHSVAPLRPEPEGFAARVARTACSLCKGWCCRNGEDHAFLDEETMARVRAQGGSWMCARCCGYMSSECRRLGTRIRAYFMENKVVHWTGGSGRCVQQLLLWWAPGLHDGGRSRDAYDDHRRRG